MGKDSVISEDDVRHVAGLARLPLKNDEVVKFKSQLSDIFDYVNQIGEMKTEDVEETSQTTGIKNSFRKDRVDKSRMLSQKEALSNAKRTYKGFFVVKAIFSGLEQGSNSNHP